MQEAWAQPHTNAPFEAAVVFDQLVNVQSVGQYRNALDTLASDVAQGPAAYIPLSNRSFFTRLMSCPDFHQHDAALQERDCIWGKLHSEYIRRSTTHEAIGFTVNSHTYQLGGQKQIAPGWFLGGSLAYENARYRAMNLPLRTDGDAFQAGVVVKRQAGPWLLAGSLMGGHGSYRSRRTIQLTDVSYQAASRWKAQYVSAGLRASYVHAQSSWYLKPMLDASLTYQRTPAYKESGAGPLNLHYESARQWSAMITPSVELGGRYTWRGNTLRPYVSAGVSWISEDDWDTKARLEGGLQQPPFRINTDLPRHFGVIKAGVTLKRKNNLELKAEYGMRFADNYRSQTGELRLGIHY